MGASSRANRKAGILALRSPDETWWELADVPARVFDYVERGESIPIEEFGPNTKPVQAAA